MNVIEPKFRKAHVNVQNIQRQKADDRYIQLNSFYVQCTVDNSASALYDTNKMYSMGLVDLYKIAKKLGEYKKIYIEKIL